MYLCAKLINSNLNERTMKKIFFMAFLAFTMNANAQEPNNVETTETDSEDTYCDADDVEDANDVSIHGFIGVNIPTNVPEGFDFAPFRSWEFDLTFAQYDYTPNDKKTTLSAGLGFGFRFYTLSGHDNMLFKDNGMIKVAKRDGEMSDLSARISTLNFNILLLVKQRFSSKFAISAGAMVNWNFYNRIRNSYEIGDEEFDISTKNIGFRPITVDVLGIMHFPSDFGVYVKYSPMSSFKKDRGPEFKALTIGLYF